MLLHENEYRLRQHAEQLADSGQLDQMSACFRGWLRKDPTWWLGWTWWALLLAKHHSDQLMSVLHTAEGVADRHHAFITQSENIYDFISSIYYKNGDVEHGDRLCAKAEAMRAGQASLRHQQSLDAAAKALKQIHSAEYTREGYGALEYILFQD